MASEKGYTLDRDERGLTARERDVLALMEKNTPTADIATQLGIGRSRAYEFVNRLREKLGIGQDPTWMSWPVVSVKGHYWEKDDTTSSATTWVHAPACCSTLLARRDNAELLAWSQTTEVQRAELRIVRREGK